MNVRSQFPQIERVVRHQKIAYLDSAATTLKHSSVIEAIAKSLTSETANVHRGAHILSDEATEKFEHVREKAREFVNAEWKTEIVFTSGTTGGLNLLARTLGSRLKPGDEILLTQMEHHSNIVPWQMIAMEKGATVKFAPICDDGSLDIEAFKKLLTDKTKIVSVVHLSNALGTLNPLKELFAAAHEVGAITVMDAAQSVSYTKIDVRDLDADFLVMSGHKLFGPTGVGFLYGRMAILKKLPPYQGGGSMIENVTEQGVTFLKPPHRFEAGTPPIAEVMGLGAALDFVKSLGFDAIQTHEKQIMQLAEELTADIKGLRRIGTAPQRGHVFSFLLEETHPSDVGALLDEQGVAVRAGHHCCQPLMKRLNIPGTVRASFSVYTSDEDVKRFAGAVRKAKEMLS
ncbi:MAG: aminotransferase class V-fold PLP-dependent enzyme [Pseudobdellovibrionaceae bacterium]